MITSGFFNSLNGDRKYNTEQLSSIFDGVIEDGIFEKVGDRFTVRAGEGNNVIVGSGKGWFKSTWINNDADIIIDCGDPTSYPNVSIDVIYIEINPKSEVRENTIRCKNGAAGRWNKDITNTLTEYIIQEGDSELKMLKASDEGVYIYPLCYIYREYDFDDMSEATIVDMIGSEHTPFITGILESISIDDRFNQWRVQMSNFADDIEKAGEEARTQYIQEMEALIGELDSRMNAQIDVTLGWTDNQKLTILEWFGKLKNQLESDDIATGIITQINRSEIEKILMNGFIDCSKVFSEDGTVITSTDLSGRKLVKTFSNNFLTSTTVLTDTNNVEIGRLVKHYSSDMIVSSSEITTLI